MVARVASRLSGWLKSFLAMTKKTKTALSGSLVKDVSLVPLIVFLVFVLSRPYRGIVQDAHIYMGRALADLDPNGVGRDLMFVHGQFGFSLFRLAATAIGVGFGARHCRENPSDPGGLRMVFWSSRLRPAIRQRRHGLGGRDFHGPFGQ
jgi:hypothetical protein